ncbi:hypothetical protein [Nostoc sp.]|uniref:hypothetical protein n=1 Tax=Nostoc sp. TaxID=1180 RepID=UPI002FFB475F
MNPVCRNALPEWFFRLLKLAIAIFPLSIASSAYTTALSIKFKASTNKIATIRASRRSCEGMN